MDKTRIITLSASITIALIMLAGAYAISKNRQDDKQPAAKTQQRSITRDELARADGKDGRDCYVAVDGTVYLIKDFSLWQNGNHTPSEGLAYCGADLSKIIDKAPHGRKMLELLIKTGSLIP